MQSMVTTAPRSHQPELLTLTVRQVTPVTPSTILISFEPPAVPLDYQPGQYLTFVITLENHTYYRSYSLITDPRLDEEPAVVVKRTPGGRVSNHLVDTLRSGSRLRCTHPAGRFVAPNDATGRHRLLMIGGGSGITPLYSIARSVLRFMSHCQVALIYCNASHEEIILHDEIKQLQRDGGDRFRAVHVLERPSPKFESLSGRLDVERTKDLVLQLSGGETHQVAYYLCGPGGLMSQAQSALRMLGVPERQILQEHFDETPPEPVPPTASDILVRFREGPQEYAVAVKSGQSLLDAAEEAGVYIASSCRMGDCGTCKGKKLSGEVRMACKNGLLVEEEATGYILTCVAYPQNDLVVVELPE